MTCYGENLHHLPTGKRIFMKDFNSDCKDMKVIYQFRKQDDLVYFIGGKDNDRNSYYYVYDLKAQQLIFTKKIIGYDDDDFVNGAFFDDFDFSYIYLPTAGDAFKRIKIYPATAGN